MDIVESCSYTVNLLMLSLADIPFLKSLLIERQLPGPDQCEFKSPIILRATKPMQHRFLDSILSAAKLCKSKSEFL